MTIIKYWLTSICHEQTLEYIKTCEKCSFANVFLPQLAISLNVFDVGSVVYSKSDFEIWREAFWRSQCPSLDCLLLNLAITAWNFLLPSVTSTLWVWQHSGLWSWTFPGSSNFLCGEGKADNWLLKYPVTPQIFSTCLAWPESFRRIPTSPRYLNDFV